MIMTEIKLKYKLKSHKTIVSSSKEVKEMQNIAKESLEKPLPINCSAHPGSGPVFRPKLPKHGAWTVNVQLLGTLS